MKPRGQSNGNPGNPGNPRPQVAQLGATTNGLGTRGWKAAFTGRQDARLRGGGTLPSVPVRAASLLPVSVVVRSCAIGGVDITEDRAKLG